MAQPVLAGQAESRDRVEARAHGARTSAFFSFAKMAKVNAP